MHTIHQVLGARYMVLLPDCHADVAEVLRSRKAKESVPDGTRDGSGRWFPTHQEEAICCQSIRRPSRAWPNSLLRHCCTRQHLEHLAAVREQMHLFSDTLAQQALALGFEGEVALRLLDEEAATRGFENFEVECKRAAHQVAKRERKKARRAKLEAYYVRQRQHQAEQYAQQLREYRATRSLDDDGAVPVDDGDSYVQAGRPPAGWNPFQAARYEKQAGWQRERAARSEEWARKKLARHVAKEAAKKAAESS